MTDSPTSTEQEPASVTSTLAAMVAGLVAGLIAARWGYPGWGERLVAIVDPIGTVWLSALQLLILPLTMAVLVAVIGRSGDHNSGRVAARSLAWFLALLAIATIATVVISPLLLSMVTAANPTFTGLDPTTVPSAPELAPSLGEWLNNLVPTNLWRALADGDLFAVMVATTLFAFALRGMPTRLRQPVVGAAEIATEWCFALAGLLFRVLPVAVFILVFTTTATSGAGLLSSLVKYVVLLSLLLIIATTALYPFTSMLSKMSIRLFASGVWSSQLLAFSTRSSVACLPEMLNAARTKLKLDPAAANVVLPLSVASFKFNMAVSALFQMFFLLHVYGIEQSAGALALSVAGLTLQSFATPGLPSGAIWTTTPIYLALGIPLEGIVLTNVVDTIPDIFKTVANVTGDMSIATIVSRR